MANYRAVATGNWSAGATWGGGAVPPDAAGHNIYSNGFTVTIDTNVDVNFISNSSVTASFVGGGTSAVAGGGFTMPSAFNITGALYASSQLLTVSAATGTINMNSSSIAAAATTGTLRHTGAANIVINNCNITGNSGAAHFNIVNTSSGNITFNTCTILAVATAGGAWPLKNETTSTGTLTFNTCTITAGNNAAYAIGNLGAGNIVVSGGVITGAGVSTGQGILSNSTGNVTCLNVAINAGSTGVGISNGSGQLTCTGCTITASNGANAITSSGVPRISGTLISSANGTQALSSSRWILNTSPTASYIQHALNGINAGSYVRFYTADNTLGQANPTDVRSGVSYASGNLTGRLTVPARGSVSLSVNYGPSMPFTATRSGTTATATLTYSYPLVVGDSITVTDASNTEWKSTYTIASVVSGTSVTFIVPDTHSATAGTGATMQTTGTAVLDPAAVASAVWGAASRTITGGTVDTLTNAPASVTPSDIWSHAARTLTSASGPSATDIRQELDSNSTKLANLDATVSSRLASSVSTNITAIKAKTDLLNTDRLAQCATTSIVGNLIAQSNS